MARHSGLTAEQAADRLAIRELFDAYAHCADTRNLEGQKSLFTEDTKFVVFMDGVGTNPSQELHGRESLTPVFENLKSYDKTTHFNGQSTVILNGDTATGESYCLAHHLYQANGKRMTMIASLRYIDKFAKVDGEWMFAERYLYADWIETRPSTPITGS